MLEPMSVDHRSKRQFCSDLLASWVILRVVFMVFTWCSMKPLD